MFQLRGIPIRYDVAKQEMCCDKVRVSSSSIVFISGFQELEVFRNSVERTSRMAWRYR